VEPENNGVRYEKQDIKAGSVTKAGIAIGVVTVAVLAALVPFMSFLDSMEARNDPPAATLERHEPGRRPPEPRLQERPTADLSALRAEEDAILTSYGWVDDKAGTVRIPVEAAMSLVAERGVPKGVGTPEPPEASPPAAGDGQ
jgi:hypothetical protein